MLVAKITSFSLSVTLLLCLLSFNACPYLLKYQQLFPV
jgi:hypothetical protein